MSVVGWCLCCQHNHISAVGASDSTFVDYYDVTHGQDGRWLLRSSRSVYLSEWQRIGRRGTEQMPVVLLAVVLFVLCFCYFFVCPGLDFRLCFSLL